MDESLPPLTPTPTPAPTPAPALPSGRITCEFCECQLTPTGGAFRLSDRARILRDQEEEIARLKVQIGNADALAETLKRDAESLREQLADMQAAKPAGRGW